MVRGVIRSDSSQSWRRPRHWKILVPEGESHELGTRYKAPMKGPGNTSISLMRLDLFNPGFLMEGRFEVYIPSLFNELINLME